MAEKLIKSIGNGSDPEAGAFCEKVVKPYLIAYPPETVLPNCPSLGIEVEPS